MRWRTPPPLMHTSNCNAACFNNGAVTLLAEAGTVAGEAQHQGSINHAHALPAASHASQHGGPTLHDSWHEGAEKAAKVGYMACMSLSLCNHLAFNMS